MYAGAGMSAVLRQKIRNAETPIKRKPKYGVTQSFRMGLLRSNLDGNTAHTELRGATRRKSERMPADAYNPV